ncbi:Abi family protein [Bifidobacterium sp. ESL0784]|uniref:Abi family protein n=1 Tax=Bifidobacterium sp. ESL0784 TaxID=2983231 RepID=UPI0023F94407|nr:Abi family protein [Bifidobacterium sp. ESL0784]MDF7641049.1 Abi family protein [Bifidobacterium sp. ESL0784]
MTTKSQGSHPRYDKPWLSIDEQCKRLESHGMQGVYANKERLARIGYYRLSGFWYMFRKIDSDNHSRSSFFMSDSRFSDVLRIYEFDRELRTALFAAIACFEISLRARLAYDVGRQDPFLYLKPALLDTVMDPVEYGSFINKYNDRRAHSREDFIKHFRREYDGQLPIWAATEIMEFGTLRKLYDVLPYPMRADIAAKYQLNQATLKSWLGCLNFIRNLCAHHGRVYNRALTVSPSIDTELSELTHIGPSPKKMYAGIAILVYLLKQENETTPIQQLKNCISALPTDIPQVDVARSMGVPANWQEEKLWRIF